MEQRIMIVKMMIGITVVLRNNGNGVSNGDDDDVDRY